MLGPLVLVCNLGSATIKLSLHEDPAAKSRSGSARWMCDVDTTTAVATWRSHGRHTTEQWELGDRTGLLDRAIRSAWEGPSPGVTEPHDIDLVGHRVVHGGADFRAARCQ